VISSEALTSLIQLHVGIKSDRRKEEIMKKKHARLLILILVRYHCSSSPFGDVWFWRGEPGAEGQAIM